MSNKKFTLDKFTLAIVLTGIGGLLATRWYDEHNKVVVSDSMQITAYNRGHSFWSQGPIAYTVESPNSPVYVGKFMLDVPPFTEIKVDIPFMYIKNINYNFLEEHVVKFSVDNQVFYQTAVVR